MCFNEVANEHANAVKATTPMLRIAMPFHIWVSNGELALNIVSCCDFQLVESGAWSSTFLGCCIRCSILQTSSFSKTKTSMDSLDM